MRVLSLLPVVGHPRDSKRIDMLLGCGVEVEVAAFERPNPINRPPRCKVTTLGRIADGALLRRVFVAASALPSLVAMARRNDIIYASGQDMGLMGWVAGVLTGRPVVMEVGDIREIQVAPGAKGALMRSVDRFLSARVALVVVTSEKFISAYYRDMLQRTPRHMVIENKLEMTGEPVPRPVARAGKPGRDGPLVIGWFGILRFQWAIDALEAVVSRAERPVRVLLAGYTGGDVDISRLQAMAEVEHVPHYRSPDDLPALYDRIDVVWCAYPVSGSGHAAKNWVRANRFYEACMYRKPLIVLEGTGDADPVRDLGVGVVLPDDRLETAVDAVNAITDAKLKAWAARLAELPASVYSFVEEPEALVAALRKIAGKV